MRELRELMGVKCLEQALTMLREILMLLFFYSSIRKGFHVMRSGQITGEGRPQRCIGTLCLRQGNLRVGERLEATESSRKK